MSEPVRIGDIILEGRQRLTEHEGLRKLMGHKGIAAAGPRKIVQCALTGEYAIPEEGYDVFRQYGIPPLKSADDKVSHGLSPLANKMYNDDYHLSKQ